MKALAFAALMAVSPLALSAQTPCGDAGEARAAAEGSGAMLVASGLSQHGHVLELWMVANGNWLIFVYPGDGRACLVDSGVGLSTAPAFNPAAANSL